MTKRCLQFLFISIFFVNCYRKNPENVKKDFAAFPVQKQLNVTGLFTADHFKIDIIDLYKDSIILMMTRGASKEKHHINMYDINKKAFLPGILEMGRKEGQSLTFFSYGIEKDFIWVYDVNKEQIISLKIDGLRNESAKHFAKPVKFPGFYYAVQLLNDTTLLASGDYSSPLDYKIAMINLTTGKTSGHMVHYSSDSSKAFTRENKMAYESFLYIKPLKDKAVLACRYADQIEIVDIKAKQSKVVRGPEGFEPKLEVMLDHAGKRIAVRGEETRYAFVSGKVTDQFIYLLYSGNTDNTDHLFYGSIIYVYDWNGKPIKSFSLKNDIKDFAITANDSLIYTFNPKTKIVSRANIKGI